jgi:hypothetical protein
MKEQKKRIRITDINKDTLKDLLSQCLSNVDIGKIMGYSKDLIDDAIYHYRLVKPTISQIAKMQYKNGRIINCKIYDIPPKEDLEYLYNDKLYSLNKIKDIFETSIPTLKKWMDNYQIKMRTIQQSVQNAVDTGVLVSKYKDKEFQKKCRYNQKEYNRSKSEISLYNFIASIYKGKIIHSYNINSINIDVYLPELNIGFEYNGLFWHSEARHYIMATKSLAWMQSYHQYKSDKAYESGIRLIHIFEDTWRDNQTKIESLINAVINKKNQKIFGRKCIAKVINPKEAKQLFDDHHLQGYTNSSKCVGLYYDGVLISAGLFTKKDEETWYMSRYVTSYQVIGGFAKIINNFRKNNTGAIYTFADLSWVDRDNNVYIANGFEVDGYLDPDYSYIVNKTRKHKFLFRHKLLKNRLANYDPNKTEYQNCLDHKLYRIWDCGKIRYVLK